MLHVGGANIESTTGKLFDMKTAEEEELKSGKFLFDDQMVLYSKIRPYLMKVALPDFWGLCSADIYPLFPVAGRLNRNYLFYLLFSPAFTDYAILGSARAGMPKVNRDYLFAFKFQLPPLPEQQRIVGILDKAFEGIAIAKANAEKNLQNVRALFESHLQFVFTQRGKGWVNAKLGVICHKITDGTHITPNYVKDGIPFLSVKDLTRGFIDFSDTRFISVAEHEFLTRNSKPVRGDILYTKVGTTGIAQVVDVDDKFSIFVSVALLKPKHNLVFNLYLEHFLNAPYAREQARKRTRGMANKNLVISDIKEIDVYFPKALDEQRTIVAKLESFSAETQRLESIYQRKLAALEELKKSLLHQAFSGQL
jgi:type I restriction enzyme S subunit